VDVQETLPAAPMRQPSAAPGAHRWQAVAIVLVAVGVFLFLSYTIPLFIPRFFDPTVQPVRWLHGGLGIIAMVTAVVQILPGVRRRFPLFHRWNGRVYVFVGVLPSAVLLVAVLFVVRDPTNSILIFWDGVWIATTLLAWRAARRRRYLEHRRWMIYSIAVTLAAATNGGLVIIAPYIAWLVAPPVLYDSLHWFPWILHLSVAHWIVTRYTAIPYPARRVRPLAEPPVRVNRPAEAAIAE